MQVRTSGIRGLIVGLMALMATLLTVGTALANTRPGPWPL